MHRVSSLSIWCTVGLLVACALVLAVPTNKRSPPLLVHNLTKRSYFEIQCKGVYDKSIFAKLDRICEDCYNLFREPSIHNLCRENCFMHDTFLGCVETLQMTDRLDDFKTYIKFLNGADPGL